jgi:hypothetical protein
MKNNEDAIKSILKRLQQRNNTAGSTTDSDENDPHRKVWEPFKDDDSNDKTWQPFSDDY